MYNLSLRSRVAAGAGSAPARSGSRGGLNLLGAPASVCLAHVARGLDGGDELEDDVGDTDNTNDATSDLGEDHVPEDEAAEEDIDWAGLEAT